MTVRHPGLQPYDWRWNRPRKAVPFAAQAPFDRHAALAAWKKCTRALRHDQDWSACRVPVDMSEPEANFWLHALTEPWFTHWSRRAAAHTDVSYETSREQAAKALDELDLSADYRSVIMQRLTQLRDCPDELANVLARLIGVEALVDLILDDRNAAARWLALENERSIREHRDALERAPRGIVAAVAIIDGKAVPVPLRLPAPPAPPVTEQPQYTAGSFLDIASRESNGDASYSSIMWCLARGFALHVAPYLANDVAAALVPRLRTSLAFTLAGTSGVRTREPHAILEIDPAVLLAASLHAHDIVCAALDTIAQHSKHYHADLDLLAFGAGNADTAERFWRTLEISWTKPEMVAQWLALTEGNGVAYAREQVASHVNDDSALDFLAALGRVVTSQTAAAMLQLTELPPLYVAARTWIEEHAEVSERVLREHAETRGHCGETAREILARFARRGLPNTLEKGARA